MVSQVSILHGQPLAVGHNDLWHVLRHNVELTPQTAMGMIHAERGVTSRDLVACHRLAATLAKQLGSTVPQGRVVAIAAACPLEALVSMWGCVEAGYDFGLVDSRVSPEWMDRLKSALGAVVLAGAGVAVDHCVDLQVEVLALGESEPSLAPPTMATERVFVVTGGSTGAANIAWRSATELAADTPKAQRSLSIHSTESVHGGLELLRRTGSPAWTVDPREARSFPNEVSRLIDIERIEQLNASAQTMRTLLRLFKRAPAADLSSLTSVSLSSAGVTRGFAGAVREAFADLGVATIEINTEYGLSELGTIASGVAPQAEIGGDNLGRPIPLAHISPGRSVRIANAAHPVPHSTVGLIETKSEINPFLGYAREVQPSVSLSPAGWVSTGDYGSIDANGLSVLGRAAVNNLPIDVRILNLEQRLRAVCGVEPGQLWIVPHDGRWVGCYVPQQSHLPSVRLDLHNELSVLVAEELGLQVTLRAIRSVPLTRSGTVARHRLATTPEAPPPDAPTDLIRIRGDLSQAWKRSLGVETRVQAHDRYDGHGGSTQGLISLIATIEQVYSVDLEHATIFADPTTAVLETELLVALSRKTQLPHDHVDRVPRALESVLSMWPGEPLPGTRLLRQVATGPAPTAPLLWVANASAQADTLGLELNPLVHLFVTRSLSGIDGQSYQPQVVESVSRIVVDDLETSSVDIDRLVIGGGCQSAIIAIGIARELHRRERVPAHLVLVEWEWPDRGGWHGPTTLVFGDENERLAPFHAPGSRLLDVFPEKRTSMIAGGHSDWWRAGHTGELSELLSDIALFP